LPVARAAGSQASDLSICLILLFVTTFGRGASLVLIRRMGNLPQGAQDHIGQMADI
jgi:hypothetical protein